MTRKPNMAPCKTPMAEQPASERVRNFDEVALGYTPEEAAAEAERCLNCPDRWCAQHCPAHNYIPEFIAKIREGDLQGAWDLLALTNPLMEISGRVCPFEQQCESHCTRGIKCEPVAIGRLERFVADWHRKNSRGKAERRELNGKKIAVVGAGPAGLTCAMSLAVAGYSVTVYDKAGRPGGVPAWGIPGFVLPGGMMDRLFDQLQEMDAKLVLNTELGKDITLDELRAENDAVFLATGAERPAALDVPGAELAVQAKAYLPDADRTCTGRVLVFGGGNTAIDAARTALRRGAASVAIVYRRTEEQMPATREEIALAKAEGVELVELTAPAAFTEADGGLAVRCEVMELAAPDYPGGRANVKASGEQKTLSCDLAILALGFENIPVEGVESDARGRIVVGKDFSTGVEGVYAGGDCVTGAATLMKAVAAGKDAAATIFNHTLSEESEL
ncbi:MAG: NAD(P)-dependent oxidoreductase [Oscillospiraceae bacterium]